MKIKYFILIVFLLSTKCFSQNEPMPVELFYFYGEVTGFDILVKWGTQTEVNNFGFFLDRAPDQNYEWEALGFVLGSGNSNTPKHYTFLDSTVSDTGVYYYRLRQVDTDGSFDISDTISVSYLTDVEEIEKKSNIVTDYKLYQNYPNPFNPTTKIRFSISANDHLSYQNISLKIFDILGKQVTTLINNKELSSGEYEINFNGSDLKSGVYFYQLTAGKYSSTKKFILMK